MEVRLDSHRQLRRPQAHGSLEGRHSEHMAEGTSTHGDTLITVNRPTTPPRIASPTATPRPEWGRYDSRRSRRPLPQRPRRRRIASQMIGRKARPRALQHPKECRIKPMRLARITRVLQGAHANEPSKHQRQWLLATHARLSRQPTQAAP